MNKNVLRLVLIVVVIVAGVVGLALWLKSASPTSIQANPDLKGEKIFIRPYSHMIGQEGAKVTLVEFADFQCPACAAHYVPVKQIVDKYKDDPNFTFVNRNFPLPSHANAKISAQAAEAAGSQGKYWEMVELLYTKQNEWAGSVNPTNIFVGYAQELGLDSDKFREDVRNSKYIDNITQDLLDGQALGINGTPTFFLNGERLGGIADLDSKIYNILTK